MREARNAGPAVMARSGQGQEPGRLTGLRAVVTGGSSGIGAATARALGARGVRVAISGRNAAALEQVAADSNAVHVTGDLREPGCSQRIIDAAVHDLGGLDLLVSNAGIGWAGSFASMSESDIDSVLDVNLRAAAQLARAAIPHLRPGLGRIIFVGSVAGLVGVPGEAWYSATKAGLGCLADVLREELRPAGIGVSLVSPGVVDTAYFERRNEPYTRRYPRLISAESAAAAIVDAVYYGRDNVIIPPWLSLPARVKARFPHLYRLLSARLA
jgi:NAD(P)-dependent dehydrogenase (short-subunit alcohol dehydrogenase family)